MKCSSPDSARRWEGMAEGAAAPRVWWSVGGRFGRPAWESLVSGGSSKGSGTVGKGEKGES